MKGQVSIVNNLLTDLNCKLPYMKLWEQELKMTFDLSEWQDIAKNFS